MTFWHFRPNVVVPFSTTFYSRIPSRNYMEIETHAIKARRITRASAKVIEESSESQPGLKRQRRAKAQVSKQSADRDEVSFESSKDASLRKPIKTRKKKDLALHSILPRVSTPWKVGAHVSSSGGVENAVTNAAAIGANAFALFVKSQRKWISPALTEKSIETFKARMDEHNYSPDVVLPHGSYLINLGNPDIDKREKSYECFLDDLKRCELLGLKLYNFHPGSTVGGATKEESISLIAQCINRAHHETKSVTTVIENMAGAGNIIGGDFADLKGIIDEVDDKSRVGVCLDTCHSFAAGYDLRTETAWNELLSQFDSVVGLSYLRGMHLNDSKTELGSRKDRHESIGLGFLGLGAFRHIMNDSRVQNIPLILETPSFEQPIDVWGKEIAVLQQLSRVVVEQKDNDELIRSIIGDKRTDEALADVVRNAVKVAQSAKPKKLGDGKVRQSRKRKRDEDSEEEDLDGED